jgi:hypothetical protein
MTRVDASGVWDPRPKGEPGPQGPAGELKASKASRVCKVNSA